MVVGFCGGGVRIKPELKMVLSKVGLLLLIQRSGAEWMGGEISFVNRSVVVLLVFRKPVGVIGSPQHLVIDRVLVILI